MDENQGSARPGETLLRGGGGELFTDARHVRADARLAVRLLRLGVFSEAEVEGVLRAMGGLVAHAAEQVPDEEAEPLPDGRQPTRPRSPRNFAALMRLWVSLAKLEASQYAPPARVLARSKTTTITPDGTTTERETSVAALAADLGIEIDC